MRHTRTTRRYRSPAPPHLIHPHPHLIQPHPTSSTPTPTSFTPTPPHSPPPHLIQPHPHLIQPHPHPTPRYYVFVVKGNSSLASYDERSKAVPVVYSGAASQPYYTAAVLDSFQFEYTLGSGSTTSDGTLQFHNPSLSPGTYYYFVRFRSTPLHVSGRGLLPRGTVGQCALH